MSLDYAKVLEALGEKYIAIGRGEESACRFEDRTKCEAVRGGLEAFLDNKPEVPGNAIVSVGVGQLYQTALNLIRYGVKNILIEKPAAVYSAQISELAAEAKKRQTNLIVAYNRRFLSSVIKAKEMIDEDGGITSFNFEFTEWNHEIVKLDHSKEIKENWFLANSTHVVDLAFHVAGAPMELNCLSSGSLPWHKRASAFVGSGRTGSGAIFAYQANWAAPGRWSVEFLTRKHRYILRPMEKLQIQKIGSVAIEDVPLDGALDTGFKPGLYLQTEKFLKGDFRDMCKIEDQAEMAKIYDRMANYGK